MSVIPPPIVTAVCNFSDATRLEVQQGDEIAIIDGRPELHFIKGQNQRSFEIGMFPRFLKPNIKFLILVLKIVFYNSYRTIVKAAKPLHSGDISRPLHDTLRHTAHGSPFGKAWGNPSDIKPDDGSETVIERSRTLDKSTNRAFQKSHDRAKKCVSENFIKERKSNALKQFSYNKLVNESVQKNVKNIPPNRPPQPSAINNKSNGMSEGMLIDLSPTETGLSLDSPRQVATSQTANKSNICILDEPIEIPTESFDGEDDQIPVMTTTTPAASAQRKIEPPPYREPPTYSNTMEFSSGSIDTTKFIPPFDSPTYASNTKSISPAHLYNMSPTPLRSNYASTNATQMFSNLSLNETNRVNNSYSDNQNANSSINLSKSITSFNESKLNDDIVNSLTAAQNHQSIQLDKISLAELEKDLYVNEKENKNLNIVSNKYNNISPNRDNYEKTPPKVFNNIASTCNTQNSSSNLYGTVAGANYQSTKNINQEIYSNTRSNYQSTNNFNLYSNNIMPSTSASSLSVASTNSSKNYDFLQKSSNIHNIDQIKSNINQLYEPRHKTITTDNQKHEFVAVSNRPVSAAFPPLPTIPPLTMPDNLYSSVAGDIYSSVIYDSTSASSVSAYGHIEPTVFNNVLESAIYDEVSELRPHRPAPQAPQGQVLSAQQIQRRLEKQQQQQIYSNTTEFNSEMHKIQLFLNEIGDQATYDEARQALASNNWDHATAVRFFKIESLLRLVNSYFIIDKL